MGKCGCKNNDMMAQSLPTLFGSNVFNFRAMKERLPKETYKALRQTIDMGTSLQPEVAAVVANAMKDWAIEKGASHYT
ncbi:MAG: glutamine synthetase III, partial [Desulfobulbaceae bacterium]|nr:glutamine synthetase III [Desulfobulbaceae bacterium]